MQRMARTWHITKAAWKVLSASRWLIVVSTAAGVVSLLVFVAVVAVANLTVGAEASADGRPPAVMWALYGVGGLLSAWVSKLAQGIVIASAAEHMDGAQPTLRCALAAVRDRVWRVLAWAALTTVVSMVLDRIRRVRIVGPLLAAVGSLAFHVVAFLALPVIVFEGVGAVEALKRSATLLKRTWGENLVFNFSINAIGLVATLPVVAVGALAVATGVPTVGAIAVAAAWFVLVAGVLSALSAVYKTALYRWATDLPVDPVFEAEQLTDAFRAGLGVSSPGG
jgi:hypothetical protein